MREESSHLGFRSIASEGSVASQRMAMTIASILFFVGDTLMVVIGLVVVVIEISIRSVFICQRR